MLDSANAGERLNSIDRRSTSIVGRSDKVYLGSTNIGGFVELLENVETIDISIE